ncbi:MAG: hypothetical protein U9R34_05540 [Nanoarchaeota archaeon]|nr:hypothetical protein [Nanoarchaeota archaeon]
MKNITLILQKLKEENKDYFKKEDVKEIVKRIEKDFKISFNWASVWTYLRQQRYFTLLIKGHYLFLPKKDDRQLNYETTVDRKLCSLLEKIGIDWYIGLDSALKIHKEKWQYSKKTVIVNSNITGKRKIGNRDYIFRLVRGKHFVDKSLIKIDYMKVSTLEKTILDIIYFSRYDRKNMDYVLQEVKELLKKTNLKEVLKLSKSYPKTVQNDITRSIG